MKTTKGYKIWQIVYPIGIYYVVSSLVYFALEMLFGNRAESYMMRQMLCASVTIPFVMSFYRQDLAVEEAVYGKKRFHLNWQQGRNILFSLVSAAAFGIALNNIIAMTPLVQASAGFQQANEAFFGGRMIYELFGSCLIIPVAEELLFRGVVYKRLRLLFGAAPAIVLSSLVFGILHANLVQFLYAGILGLLLAFLVEKTGYLYTAVLGHIAVNIIAVLRSETGWLDFSYETTANGIGFTMLMLLIAAAVIGFMVKEYREEVGE